MDIQNILQASGALLKGHFLLTSGRHSDQYVEKFRLLEQPHYLDQAAEAMVADINPDDVDVVLGAAVGGILLAGAVARILGKRTIFTERVDGKMTLRRGFNIDPGEKVLVVEDIVTTGGSILELLDVVRQCEGKIVKVVWLVDRSTKSINFGAPGGALLRMAIDNWAAVDCPLCKQGMGLTERGRSGKSR